MRTHRHRPSIRSVRGRKKSLFFRDSERKYAKVMADVNARRKQQSKLVESLAKRSHFDVTETEDLLGLYK